ncbi:hypothetical protein TNIN_163991 [Trichonephila inaurata madagascariensis]|uniref:Uncharacterized protein n=1 Tax=Trichonephila inaurata madagascariensis TaxID=2747483 RepID=A0A8X7CQD9_9ARAC|nr:hypothetical protein TNIN_163991 [Trichonephila inaurata madagascariensis]
MITKDRSAYYRLNPNKSHQMAPRGNTSSAADNKNNSNNEDTINLEALLMLTKTTHPSLASFKPFSKCKKYLILPSLYLEMQSFNCIKSSRQTQLSAKRSLLLLTT